MPQLDANTFIYQYIGIISIFAIIYITLSYLVLPIILRLITFRAKFLDSNQALGESLSSVSPFYKNSLILSSPLVNHFYNQLNSLVIRSSTVLNTLLIVLVGNSTKNFESSVNITKVISSYFVLSSDFYVMLALVYYELTGAQ